MYTIRMPSGAYLEGDFSSLTFEMNNQVFSTSDAGVLPGSFSFPADVPLTGANKVALDHPELVTNARNWQVYEGVWVECYGVPMFYGTLKIVGSDARKAKLNIVANPMRALRDVPLRELDLGGVRDIGNTAAMLAHALDTANDPLDYDYVFFPLLNPHFLDALTSDTRCYFQNYYSVDAGAFQVAADYPALMPFIRVEYLLSRIFADTEFSFVNAFQTSDELRRLCLFNVRSLWQDALSEKIDLRNHVSDTKATEFVKKLAGVFNLGIFTNIFSRSIRLVPLEQLLRRPPRRDWTEWASSENQIGSGDSNAAPEYFTCKDISADAASDYYTKQHPRPAAADVLATVVDISDILLPPYATEGIYYVSSRWAYYYYHPTNPPSLRFELLYSELGFAPTRSGKNVFEIAMPTLFDFWHFGEFYPQPASSPPIGAMPHVRTGGNVRYTPSGGEQILQEHTVDDRLVWYRGTQQDNDLVGYPRACSSPYNNFAFKVDDYALRVDGAEGLYEQWWKTWHTMLRSGKHVTQQFALPVSELVQFSFEDKIRVLNMDYFVKKLRVGRTLGASKVLVEASMVSVI